MKIFRVLGQYKKFLNIRILMSKRFFEFLNFFWLELEIVPGYSISHYWCWCWFCKFCLCVCRKFTTYSLCHVSQNWLLIWWTFFFCAVIFCGLNCIEVFWFDVEVSFLPNYKLFGVRAFSILLGYTYGDMIKHELQVTSYQLPVKSLKFKARVGSLKAQVEI